MKVTRERKIYAAVLGLGLLGLTLDRAIYGSQEPKVEPEQAEAVLAPTTVPAPSAANATEEASLAARLASTANDPQFDPGTIREPFSAQIPWLTPPPANATAPTSAEQFARNHTLTAVLGNSQSGYAIVDGICVRMGKPIDGFRLIGVDAKSATFENGGLRIKLQLKSGLASNS